MNQTFSQPYTGQLIELATYWANVDAAYTRATRPAWVFDFIAIHGYIGDGEPCSIYAPELHTYGGTYRYSPPYEKGVYVFETALEAALVACEAYQEQGSSVFVVDCRIPKKETA